MGADPEEEYGRVVELGRTLPPAEKLTREVVRLLPLDSAVAPDG